jgi:hypothetical protein
MQAIRHSGCNSPDRQPGSILGRVFVVDPRSTYFGHTGHVLGRFTLSTGEVLIEAAIDDGPASWLLGLRQVAVSKGGGR